MRIPQCIALCLGAGALLLAPAVRADIPTDYKGKPFDPAVAGGAGIIPATVKAGPYAIPGRIDFVNYDLGGEGVAFHAGDHITNKAGAGYRTDNPPATLCKTSASQMDVWYMTGTALEGTTYPDATNEDFYIGAVQVNDYFNFTVNVQTAGTYMLSTTWSSGNGPPGGEGGDGAMGLQVYANGTKLADWSDTFPNFDTKASFHFWKPYPNFAMVTLAAGAQVIQLKSTSKHLNLDYMQFDLMGAAGGSDGGAGAPGAGGSSDAGATTGAAGTGGTTGAAGATGTGGDTGTTGAGGSSPTTGAAGTGATGAGGTSGTTTGTAGSSAGGTTGNGTGAGGVVGGGGTKSSSSGCSIAASGRSSGSLAVGGLLVVAGLLARRRRRSR
jgi:MYXO-CTERM domain-containing protein